ncbi:MAG TPA: hypothetical protein PKO45_10780 [Rubrivivax sp.]|nr:hypothetical protein [Burkholderiales bacterium]HNT39590.1 hypothetical protein [Rubrivivax sp.]
MTNVKAIEEAVKALPPRNLAAFRRGFAEFDFAAWDARIEADADAGLLDELVQEAATDFARGGHRVS